MSAPARELPVIDAEVVAVNGVPAELLPTPPVQYPPAEIRRPVATVDERPAREPARFSIPRSIPMGVAIPGVIAAAVVIGEAIRTLALTTDPARSDGAIVAIVLVLLVGGVIALVGLAAGW